MPNIHDDHDLVYVEEGVTTFRRARISGGDVMVDFGVDAEIEYGRTTDTYVRCNTCDIRIPAGTHGLAEYWAVLGDISPNPRAEHLERSVYRAYFVPQAWSDDNAVAVDPEGPSSWMISKDHIAAHMPDPFKRRDRDWVQSDPAAPVWIQKWDGPFFIEVFEVQADGSETDVTT